jgi:hypothetical protein
MKIEINWNKINGNWFYGIGICLDKLTWIKEYEWVFRIQLIIFSIYIRW